MAYSLVRWAGNADRAPIAITFTDILDSTAHRERIGDEAMDQALDAHVQRSRMLIAEHCGFRLKWLGDGEMSAFRSADKALDYLLALHADPGHPEITIRGVIHVGTVRLRKDDIDGRHVNIAARIVGANKGSDIWVSDEVMNDIISLRAIRHSHLQWERRDLEFKGLDNRFTVWALSLPCAQQQLTSP